MTVDLSRLDVPVADIEAEACYLNAAARTNSPSDKLACYLDIKLQHPAVPLSTEADYPEWAAQLADRLAADNQRAKESAR